MTGSGSGTKIFAGGATWRSSMHEQEFVTADGGLNGATLDYKDGLQGAGFSIDNPNAQRTCGCGQSFS